MSNQNNSRPAPAPVVVVKDQEVVGISLVLLLPAILASIVFNGGLMVLLYFIFQGFASSAAAMETVQVDSVVNAEPADEKPSRDPFLTSDVDPAAQEPDTDIQYNVDRKAEVSVPGMVNPNEAVGILDASKEAPPVNLPAPGGFGAKGQGGSIEGPLGSTNAPGMLGGYGPRGLPLAGTFYGRSGATREFALRDGGGTKESEAAVARGLQWLARHQMPDGHWMLDDPRFKDKGKENDVAGTAFGLLPLLGAGKTHKPAKDNPYDKPIEKALLFLLRKQDKRTGYFGGGMYAHGLATIAICEAYGLTQDPNLPARSSSHQLHRQACSMTPAVGGTLRARPAIRVWSVGKSWPSRAPRWAAWMFPTSPCGRPRGSSILSVPKVAMKATVTSQPTPPPRPQ